MPHLDTKIQNQFMMYRSAEISSMCMAQLSLSSQPSATVATKGTNSRYLGAMANSHGRWRVSIPVELEDIK